MPREPWGQPGLEVWEGKPGHGKTYRAVNDMTEWLASDNPVISNVKMLTLPKRMLVTWGSYYYVEDSDLREFTDGTNGEKPILKLVRKVYDVIEKHPGKHPLLLIDEAHEYFPAGLTKNPQTVSISGFLSKHRHLGISIIVITQDASMLDKKFRVLAQEFRRHENLVTDPILNQCLWFITRNFHIAYSVSVAGGKVKSKSTHARKWYTIKSSVANAYNTRQTHELNVKVAKLVQPGRWRFHLVWCFFIATFAFITWAGFYIRSVVKAPKPANRAQVMKDLTEKLAGEVLSAWDNDNGTTSYIILDDAGTERVVDLPSSAYSVAENYEVVGQRVVVSLPKAREQNLREAIEQNSE